MTLFKNTVALEACPTKTAESVSYIATFAVLAWLMISNYSGLGDAGIDGNSLASRENAPAEVRSDLPAVVAPMALASAVTESSSRGPLSNPVPQSLDITAQAEAHYTPLTELAAWHNKLQSSRPPVTEPEMRQFSAAAWNGNASIEAQLAGAYKAQLKLTLPISDIEPLMEPAESANVARSEGNDTRPIREITITGSEGSRLLARPDNISRPQLPRPYRAQEIQRSLVLPPRIQALRP